jgi:hypothetical protein
MLISINKLKKIIQVKYLKPKLNNENLNTYKKQVPYHIFLLYWAYKNHLAPIHYYDAISINLNLK